jgi:hypothetical protein
MCLCPLFNSWCYFPTPATLCPSCHPPPNPHPHPPPAIVCQTAALRSYRVAARRTNPVAAAVPGLLLLGVVAHLVWAVWAFGDGGTLPSPRASLHLPALTRALRGVLDDARTPSALSARLHRLTALPSALAVGVVVCVAAAAAVLRTAAGAARSVWARFVPACRGPRCGHSGKGADPQPRFTGAFVVRVPPLPCCSCRCRWWPCCGRRYRVLPGPVADSEDASTGGSGSEGPLKAGAGPGAACSGPAPEQWEVQGGWRWRVWPADGVLNGMRHNRGAPLSTWHVVREASLFSYDGGCVRCAFVPLCGWWGHSR